MAVPSYAKYIPLLVAILGAVIAFLQQNPASLPYEGIILTISLLLYAILHDLEAPVTLPGTNQAQKV